MGPEFFQWVFRGSQIFSRGYFMSPQFFLMGILRVQHFLSWAILYFSGVYGMRKSSRKVYLKFRSKFTDPLYILV